jgi:hypothetical protein
MENWYYGLADCNGVESFTLVIDEIADLFLDEPAAADVRGKQFALTMRAHSNQQRHAVVYRVKLDQEASKIIEELIKKGDYIEALVQIKARAIETQLGTYATTLSAAKKNWDMIPNPSLDPYGA